MDDFDFDCKFPVLHQLSTCFCAVDGKYKTTNSAGPQQASSVALQGRMRQSLIHLRYAPERMTREGNPRECVFPLPSHQRSSAAQEECFFCHVADTVPQRTDSG